MVEESIVNLLEQVVRSAYKTAGIARPSTVGRSSATLSTTLNSFSAGNGKIVCRCVTSLAKSEYPCTTCVECFAARLDRRSINTVRSYASVRLLRASWNRADRWWILPWTPDFPAIATTPVASARNLLKPHRAFDLAGLR